MTMNYKLYKHDLPDGLVFGDVLSVDSEFMGLNPWRDRLCLLQIYDGNDEKLVRMVQFEPGKYDAPNVKRLLADNKKEKIFYFARGDMRWIGQWLGIILENVYCVKMASRVARTYTQSHNLEDVLRHVLGIKLSKEQQCTNWGETDLSDDQLKYACNDVLYLHALRDRLEELLDREGRTSIALGLNSCLPAVVRADLAGWINEDLFAYHVPKV